MLKALFIAIFFDKDKYINRHKIMDILKSVLVHFYFGGFIIIMNRLLIVLKIILLILWLPGGPGISGSGYTHFDGIGHLDY